MNKDIKKNVYLQLRISQEEKIIIQKKAEEFGLSVSDFIRQTTLGYRVRNNATQKATLRNIARIASNLNQVARQVNTFKTDTDKVQLLTALLSIEEEIIEVRKCI